MDSSLQMYKKSLNKFRAFTQIICSFQKGKNKVGKRLTGFL